MADAQHRLERRATLLAGQMDTASKGLAQQLGAGERPLFTTPMTKAQSLDWWRLHRHDEAGAAALARLQPWDIARLDADLQAYINGPEGVAGG